ncbi:hypothetical protein FNV43_RR10822 [Rhamnella rubrinervis]|uniref:Ion transport domain-containing protein n=1 Tax=Rhamnella rubrinervis TaxID=2594499 RepID=A0A8K0H4N1_9ROSA|nr:hypothetical protein FNV43_RR10822 [Rhamnella rubrinervis]
MEEEIQVDDRETERTHDEEGNRDADTGRAVSEEVDAPGVANFRRIWGYFMLGFAFITSLYVPVQFGFYNLQPTWFPFAMDCATSAVWITDAIIKFYFSVSWKFGSVLELLELIIFIIPFVAISEAIHPKLAREIVRGLIWLRIGIARKVIGQARKWRNRTSCTLLLMMGEVIFVLYFTVNAQGCIYFYEATVWPPSGFTNQTWIATVPNPTTFLGRSFLPQFITTMYLAVITICTIGYGDIHPTNIAEYSFTFIFSPFNIVVAIYIGEVVLIALKKSLLATAEGSPSGATAGAGTSSGGTSFGATVGADGGGATAGEEAHSEEAIDMPSVVDV